MSPPSRTPWPLPAWLVVDGAVAWLFGLDESKYQWVIDRHERQQAEVGTSAAGVSSLQLQWKPNCNGNPAMETLHCFAIATRHGNLVPRSEGAPERWNSLHVQYTTLKEAAGHGGCTILSHCILLCNIGAEGRQHKLGTTLDFAPLPPPPNACSLQLALRARVYEGELSTSAPHLPPSSKVMPAMVDRPP